MHSKAATVEAYLAGLPADRREALQTVREVILNNLDRDYAEGMSYGMIGYAVPHSVFPAGYHCDPAQPLPFAGLASQKNHMSVYLMCVYGHAAHEAWFREAWAKTGKKLDMGKACIRFKKVEDLALDVLAEAIRRVPARVYIKHYEASLNMIKSRTSKGPPPKESQGKTPSKKAPTKKVGGKKKARKQV